MPNRTPLVVAALAIATPALAQNLVANDGQSLAVLAHETYDNVEARGWGTTPPAFVPGLMTVLGTVRNQANAYDAATLRILGGSVGGAVGISAQAHLEMYRGFGTPADPVIHAGIGMNLQTTAYMQQGHIKGTFGLSTGDDAHARVTGVTIDHDVDLRDRSTIHFAREPSSGNVHIGGTVRAHHNAHLQIDAAWQVGRVELNDDATAWLKGLTYDNNRPGTIPGQYSVASIDQNDRSFAEYHHRHDRWWNNGWIRGTFAVEDLNMNDHARANVFGIDAVRMNLNHDSTTTMFGGTASKVIIRDRAKFTWNGGRIMDGIDIAGDAFICVNAHEFTAFDNIGNITPIDLTGPDSSITLDATSDLFYSYVNHEGLSVYGFQGLTAWKDDGSSFFTDFWFETEGVNAWTGSLVLTVPSPSTLAIPAMGLLAIRRRR